MYLNEIKEIWLNYNKKFKEDISFNDFCLRYFPMYMWGPANKKYELLSSYVRGVKILNAGCGRGWVEASLIQRRFEIYSVDVHPAQIELYSKIQATLNPDNKPNILQADLTHLPFDNGYFDTVFSFAVLPHIDDLGKTFSELKRVLKDNGRLIVTIGNNKGLYCLIHDYLKERFIYWLIRKDTKDVRTHHVNLHGFKWWENNIKESGFEIERVHNVEFLSPLIAFFGYKRCNFFSKIDTKLCERLPKQIASEWLFVLKKEKI